MWRGEAWNWTWGPPFLSDPNFTLIISWCKDIWITGFQYLEIRVVYQQRWQHWTLKNSPVWQRTDSLKSRITTSFTILSLVTALGVEIQVFIRDLFQVSLPSWSPCQSQQFQCLAQSNFAFRFSPYVVRLYSTLVPSPSLLLDRHFLKAGAHVLSVVISPLCLALSWAQGHLTWPSALKQIHFAQLDKHGSYRTVICYQ